MILETTANVTMVVATSAHRMVLMAAILLARQFPALSEPPLVTRHSSGPFHSKRPLFTWYLGWNIEIDWVQDRGKGDNTNFVG